MPKTSFYMLELSQFVFNAHLTDWQGRLLSRQCNIWQSLFHGAHLPHCGWSHKCADCISHTIQLLNIDLPKHSTRPSWWEVSMQRRNGCVVVQRISFELSKKPSGRRRRRKKRGKRENSVRSIPRACAGDWEKYMCTGVTRSESARRYKGKRL